jgi:hypothetical protein
LLVINLSLCRVKPIAAGLLAGAGLVMGYSGLRSAEHGVRLVVVVLHNGNPVLIKTANYVFVDDAAGKPVGMHRSPPISLSHRITDCSVTDGSEPAIWPSRWSAVRCR